MDNRLPSVPESAQDRDIQLRYGVARVLLVSVDCVRSALVDSHAAMMPYLNVPIPDSSAYNRRLSAGFCREWPQAIAVGDA
jgi:hypothetical protein